MKRSHVLLALVAVLVLSTALPAIGASPNQLLKKAIKTSKSADKRSKEALKIATETKASAGPQGPAGAAGKDGKDGVDGVDAVPGPQEGWHVVGTGGEPAFLNSWVNADFFAESADAAFAKNEDGVVFIRGQVKGGTVSTASCAASAVFQLPADYRPSDQRYFSALTTNGANVITPGYVEVTNLGNVCVPVGNNAFVSIDVSFRL